MTEPAPTVWPSLRYTDAPAAIRFIVDVLGFSETAVYRGADDTVAHAQLTWPAGGGVMLGSANTDGTWQVPSDAGGCYVVVESPDDIDAVFTRAVAAGATGVREPRTPDYGGRECSLRDPWGVHWSFGTYRGDPG